MTEFSLDEYMPDKNTEVIANMNQIYADIPIIQYALDELIKNDTSKTTDYSTLLLTVEQMRYINLYDSTDGTTLADVCSDMNIRKSTVIMWMRCNKLFNACIELIKQTEAEQAESCLWSSATDAESKDSISRMFALKARKPEYRDNAILPGASVVSIRVTIDNKEFDTSASMKVINEED